MFTSNAFVGGKPTEIQALYIAYIYRGSGFFWTWLAGGIVSVSLGHMAMREIRNSGGLLHGVNFARVGLVLGYLEVLVPLVRYLRNALGIF